MKEGNASPSAEGVTAIRAGESMRPEDERVCYDPLAKEFLGTELTNIINDPQLTEAAVSALEQRTPGTIGCVVSRTRYIDDYLNMCIDDGIEQLVILGAGYDTRAYRFDQLKEKVNVFELDHIATQKVKLEKVKKIFGTLPNHVVYIPIDFDKEKLGQRLFESGYDKKLKTLFIWEGVTMYITEEAVDETLSFVAENSGSGSSIIFNYTFQSVLDGTCELEYAANVREDYERRGEPLTFGIQEGAIEEFLSKRGFYQVNNVTGDFFRSSYFKGVNQDRNVCCLCGFVTATVKPR